MIVIGLIRLERHSLLSLSLERHVLGLQLGLGSTSGFRIQEPSASFSSQDGLTHASVQLVIPNRVALQIPFNEPAASGRPLTYRDDLIKQSFPEVSSWYGKSGYTKSILRLGVKDAREQS